MTVQNKQWQTVCSLEDLVAHSGVAALVNGKQIALFYLPENDTVFATDNYCPFADANVLARGIVGDLKGKTVITSPIYKQHFCLNSGTCLEDENVTISVFETQIENNQIQVAV